MPRLEFFFDISSPWTYLAFTQIEQVVAEGGGTLDYRPILVGGVFNAVNDSVYASRENPNPVKLRHYVKDLDDWARHVGIVIGQPPVFPVNSVKVMRGCFVAAEKGLLRPYAQALFEAYWGRLEDISQDGVIVPVLDALGIERAEFFEKIGSAAYKDRLRANTDELIARGGFGSPTMFVDETDMYFGNDRLPLVAAALKRRAAA